MSLAYIPALMSAVSHARKEDSGLASGIVNTSYQIGSARLSNHGRNRFSTDIPGRE
ncbi:MAG TPA: hypothetical protein VE264_07465 [Nitrososphaera sp.]|nr:hypothetical protein [Nitrososphaera sp.]